MESTSNWESYKAEDPGRCTTHEVAVLLGDATFMDPGVEDTKIRKRLLLRKRRCRCICSILCFLIIVAAGEISNISSQRSIFASQLVEDAASKAEQQAKAIIQKLNDKYVNLTSSPQDTSTPQDDAKPLRGAVDAAAAGDDLNLISGEESDSGDNANLKGDDSDAGGFPHPAEDVSLEQLNNATAKSPAPGQLANETMLYVKPSAFAKNTTELSVPVDTGELPEEFEAEAGDGPEEAEPELDNQTSIETLTIAEDLWVTEPNATGAVNATQGEDSDITLPDDEEHADQDGMANITEAVEEEHMGEEGMLAFTNNDSDPEGGGLATEEAAAAGAAMANTSDEEADADDLREADMDEAAADVGDDEDLDLSADSLEEGTEPVGEDANTTATGAGYIPTEEIILDNGDGAVNVAPGELPAGAEEDVDLHGLEDEPSDVEPAEQLGDASESSNVVAPGVEEGTKPAEAGPAGATTGLLADEAEAATPEDSSALEAGLAPEG
eukprot:scaffold79929_cov34-Prasinocladus_malaysianus.AAC.1